MSTTTTTTGVLFVCLGNICRSPMAEAVFNHTIKRYGIADYFRVDSAGTSGWHIGDTPDERSVACCRRHNVPVNHLGRQVTQRDFEVFDHILCMDRENLHNLERVRPKRSTATVRLFGEYDPEGDVIIRDPYYGGEDGFERNFQQVTRCCEAFLRAHGFVDEGKNVAS